MHPTPHLACTLSICGTLSDIPSFLMSKLIDNATGQKLWNASLIMRNGTRPTPSTFTFVALSMMTSMKISSFYNELMDYIQKNAENDKTLWHFKHISGHQEPLRPGDPHYAGAKYNVQVEWETGKLTYEPLDIIAADDPITGAVYARDNDLIDLPAGWKHFKKLAMRERQLLRLIRQAKMHSYKSSP